MKRRFWQKVLAAIGGLLLLGVGSWAAIQEEDPGGEAKVGDVTYQTLTEAITQANNSGGQSLTVTLLKNVNVSTALSITSPMTLDLNGHEISGTGTNLLDVNLAGGGEVTIKGEGEDSKLTLDGGNSGNLQTINLEEGTLNLQGGTITATTTSTRGNVVAVNAGSDDDSKVTVNLTGSNLVANGGSSARGITTPKSNAVTGSIAPKVIISGGTIKATSANGAVGVYGNGNVNITAGEIDVNGKNRVYGLWFPNTNRTQATNYISGGTIKVNATTGRNAYVILYGPVVVTGGNFYLNGDNARTPVSSSNGRYYPISIIAGNFNKDVADQYVSKESRKVAGTSSELPYAVERSKFSVSITGYNPEEEPLEDDDNENAVYREPVTVSSSVFKDYSLLISLPSAEADEVGVDTTTVNVSMTGVTSLDFGSDETRSLTKGFNLGLYPETYRISEKLPHAYAFGGATVPVKVIDDDEAATTKEFTYTLGAFNNNVIKGTADDEAKAAEAWDVFAKHVEMATDPVNANTHMLFKKGAYLQIGDERLVFLNDFDFLADNATSENLFKDAQVQIQKVNETGASSVKSVVYLPVGSTIGLGHSTAVVNDNVSFTTDGSANAGSKTVTGFFTTQKGKENDKSLALNTLLEFFDGIIDYVDNNGVSFTVKFTKTKGTPKFHLDVTGYDYDDPTKEIPVNADVYGDYSFDVALPDPLNDNLSASKATVHMTMTGVQSLGFNPGETRSYDKTVETGVDLGHGVPLSAALQNTYKFGQSDVSGSGVVCPVTITDDGITKAQFQYNIQAITKDYHIIGIPQTTAGVAGTEGTNAARQAWQYITNNVQANKISGDDTHLLFKKGAYIQIGNERLVFVDDFDFLKGTATMENLFSDAKTRVEKLTDENTHSAVIYLPAGSTLGVSSSAATVKKDVTLTVDGSSFKPDGAISSLKTAKLEGDNAKQIAIAALVYSFDQIIGLVDTDNTVSFTVAFTQPAPTPKFHVGVTGYNKVNGYVNPVSVTADVFGDYHFDVTLPDNLNADLTADSATVDIAMTGVQSLGLAADETRSYSKTVKTGVSDVNVNLADALQHTYAFTGATCPVTIKDAAGEKSFSYNIVGITEGNPYRHIIGTPSSTDDARAAWQKLTSHVSTQKGITPEDTHILFKKGAYLQIGDERLVFLKDFDFLKGGATMDKLFDGAQVRIEKANVTGAKSVKAAAYLPVGSTLGVSNSAATVDQDVKVTMAAPAGKVTDENAITDFFTNLKNGQQLNVKLAIAALVYTFDGVIGEVNALGGAEFTVEFTQPKPVKFHLDVTGYDATTDDPIAVNVDVYNDYSFKVSLPDPLNDNLTASKATVNISMTGVQTLGLKEDETRSYSKDLESGVTGISAKLSDYLKRTYAFNGVKAPVTIKDENDTKEFTYNIDGVNEDYQIVGTPSSEDAARAAWHLLTSHVKANQDLTTNDTHFLFKKGAYLQIGDEKLVFDADYDFLKGSANLDELFSGIRPYVRVLNIGLTGDALKTASVYLPAGSTLGVSSSAATVDENVKVTMDLSKSTVDESNFKNLLSGYRDRAYSENGVNKTVAIALLVYYFDQVIGVADGAEEVPFTVEFTKPETPKFHLDVTGYSSDAEDADSVPVDADVYGDYHFVVSLPAPDIANLVASKATVNIAMNGVQTLGLKEGETRSYRKTVETGVPGVTANLANFLTKTYAFNGATCPVTVKDENGSDEFSYQIAGINDMYQIIGTPVTDDGTNGTDAARAAWHRLTSHVKAQSGVTPEDTHFLFKKGAFLQIGNERIVFLNDFDFLKGAASMETLFDGANTRIEKVNKTADAKAVVYLPEGSTLGVSSSAATIDEDVFVTMDGNKTGAQVSDIFSSMSSGSNLNAKTAILFLVQTFDAVVGAVDQADGVSFTVEFKKNVAKTTKFHLDVTGYDYDDLQKGVDTPITVAADVYSDYSFLVSLPDILNDNLSASKATLNVWMENVQSLGVGQKREFSKTVETGVNIEAKLSSFLKNTYKFNGVTAPVTIKDGDEEHSFTYNIAAIDSAYHIIGTPSSEADARIAWKFMTNDKHLEAKGGITPEDSHFLFKKGSFIQIGNQKLVFTHDFDFLKGGVKQDATLADLFASAQVEQQEATDGADDLAEVYLTAGSTLGLSSSAATVKKNVAITMRGATLASNDQVKELFSGLQNLGNLDARTAIGGLVYAFDAIIGQVDAAEKVSFTVEFTDGDVLYKKAESDDWATMYSDADNYFDIDGDALSGFKVNSDQEDVNIRFTRNFTADRWAAWVAPFDMPVTEELLDQFDFVYPEGISNNNKDIDKDNLTSDFVLGVKEVKVGKIIKANMPYFVKAKESGRHTFDVTNTTLKTTEPILNTITGNAYHYNFLGVYETKHNVAGDSWFALKGGVLHPAGPGSSLKPFRTFMYITDREHNPYDAKQMFFNIQILDDAVTGINGIEDDANGEQKIYDLQGRRVYKPTVKGVYIVNGKKVVLGK